MEITTREERYEINNKGELVVGIPRVSTDRKKLVEQLFSRYGWKYEILSEITQSHYHIRLTNDNLEKSYTFHLFHGNVRKEDPDRNRAEKKIQLGGLDPREIKNEMCIILGFYIFENDDINDTVVVAWPVEDNKNYPNNPSLRVNMKQDILPAKNKGIYFDLTTGKRIVAFKPDFIYYYLENYLDLHGYGRPAESKSNNEPLSHSFYGMHITRRNTAVDNGEISIGWSDLGDLSSIDNKEKLVQLMDTTYPDKKLRSKAQDVSQVWTFRNGMSIGDYVVFSDGTNAHIGIIKSDYYYEIDELKRDADYVNNRKVEWLKTISREDLPKVFRSALAATRSVFSLNAYKSIILELLEKGVVDIDEEDENDIVEEEIMEERPYIELNFTTNIDCDFERNRIVFGAPGTGKSFQMEEDRAKLVKMGGGYERVTFHPDYTYSSFVGCYKPVSEKGKIEYKYVPGPFMRVLVDALRSGLKDEQAKPYLLVIEEINRAKVAAVFGEVFQLLDRDENGTSDYEIHTSEDVKKYLSDELGGSLDSFARIRIPNNMFIWATMNSADQGVFPMDTAFKRRWSFEYKGIDENQDKVGGKIVLGKGEHEFEVDWNILRKAINDVLAKKFNVNEDKLMGPFFIGEDVFAFGEDGKIKNPTKFIKVFKSKVIMYLYEDAAKQYKHKLFSGCDSTKYSSICDAFEDIGIDIFGVDFKDTYNDMR